MSTSDHKFRHRCDFRVWVRAEPGVEASALAEYVEALKAAIVKGFDDPGYKIMVSKGLQKAELEPADNLQQRYAHAVKILAECHDIDEARAKMRLSIKDFHIEMRALGIDHKKFLKVYTQCCTHPNCKYRRLKDDELCAWHRARLNWRNMRYDPKR